MYKMIRKDFPKLPLIYFSDSGEVPYGKLSKKALRSRIEKVFKFLNADMIIVACHSASSVVKASDKNVVGLRIQTVKAVATKKPKYVGIIGGGRTIRSGFYRRELNKLGIKTSQRIAQPLSILVERGEVSGALVEGAVKKIMKPLMGYDYVLLACTHYPVLSKVISKNTSAKLIDPVNELYRSIYKDLKSIKATGKTVFITTGNTNLMKVAARKAFDVKITNVRRVTI